MSTIGHIISKDILGELDTREETGLKNTEEEAADEELDPCIDETHSDRDLEVGWD